MDTNSTQSKCALCDEPIALKGDSDEHIIPNSIGGHRKVRGFICVGCNSRAGDGWDAEVWRQFQHITSMHGIVRDRGEMPSIPVQTGSGKQLILMPDGDLMPRKIVFDKKPNPDGEGFVINASVRTEEEAEKMVRNIAAKHPEIDVEGVLAKIQPQSEFLDSPLHFKADFGGPLGGRSMVKTAIAMAYDAGVNPQACNLALPYLLDEDESPPYGMFYMRDLVSQRAANYTPHIVSVLADPVSRFIWAYVEYFGMARIVVPLSDRYDGESFQSTYAINPSTGAEIAVDVDLRFSDDEIERIRANTAYTDEQYLAVANASFGTIYFRCVRRQVRKAFNAAAAYAASQLGIEHGDMIAPEQATAFASHLTEKIMPVIIHMQKSGIPIAEAMRVVDDE
jgi:hypothetical protein